MNKWISVNDSLPEIDTGVLTYQPIYGGLWIIVVACLNKNNKWVTIDFWTDDVIHELEPTHWMTLPDTPNKG